MKYRTIFAATLLFSSGLATAETAQTEAASARYQLTYAEQRHFGFGQARESASGNLSLSNRSDRMYTLTATAHLGARPWSGGEVYVNIEEAAGVPFTRSLVGLGGFPNGEITRGATERPKAYLQRFFVRQTWGMGGGTDKIDSDFNQMASLVDRNRIVLTAGNFSLLDIFDDNAYAKDPRTQFMNWSNWTYAAYDYAADARGFGWGATLASHRGDWVFRLGRMTTPKEPNALAIDTSIFKHYGDQIEVERRFVIAGESGRVRLLGWRNRAVMARFSDALDYYNRGTPIDRQAILQVRRGERIKYGFGANIEQAISGNAGVYLRMMRADGKTETLAFTEVDASVSTGLLLNGALWVRPSDSVGVAFAQNYLSQDRRRYLESGALSFFIGDGYLRYRPESILEMFYSFGISKWAWITADFQHIRNPAYNADRGPINITGLRLHLEF